MTGKTIRVLMIEDDPEDAAMTREALKEDKLAIDLVTVQRAEEAEEKLRAGPLPDLILLDLHLPGKSGTQFLCELRKDERYHALPVVVLTSSQADADVQESYRCGANCYVTKPVDFNQFAKLVRRLSEFWFTVVRLPTRPS